MTFYDELQPQRHTAGLDIAVFLVHWNNVHPYIKGTSFFDRYWGMNGVGFGAGGGIEFAVSSSISIFGEFMYEYAGYTYKDNFGRDFDHNLGQVAFNLGATYALADGRFNQGAAERVKKAKEPVRVSSDKVRVESSDRAIANISRELIRRLPANSTIVIVNVSSDNKELSMYIVDELEYRLVGANKFRIVDRRRLEVILSEHKFQMTGLVSDSSVVSIGEMLGANIVITGDITHTGSQRRLSIRALDVKTAQIVAMSRDTF